MPYLPKLTEQETYQQVTDTFLGYNHNLKIQEGEMYDERNLSSDHYPMLASRVRRGTLTELTNPAGCFAKAELGYVDNGRLYYDGQIVEGLQLAPGEKQFVSMGVKLIIWPDCVAVDVLTGEWEKFGHNIVTTATCRSSRALSFEKGNVVYKDVTMVPTVQISTSANTLIVTTYGKDVSAIGYDPDTKTWDLPDPVYKVFNEISGLPYSILEKDDIIIPYNVNGTFCYYNYSFYRNGSGDPVLPDTKVNDSGLYVICTGLKITQQSGSTSMAEIQGDLHRAGYEAPEVEKMFKPGDTLRIIVREDRDDGFEINTVKMVYGSVIDSGGQIEFENPLSVISVGHKAELRIQQYVPDMDYITEASNRIWGCKYGDVDGQNINEIYACKLGNYRSWDSYQGISTDSYTASVGSDGKWTGAATFQGNPIFFKENAIHKVFVSSTGAHQISEVSARGVQDGCDNSIAIVGDKLFYLSRSGVMLYDNSAPQLVSEKLGSIRYHDAAAGTLDEKYYISMRDDDGNWSMFVLDTANGLWHREDDTHASSFARVRNELYYIDADNGRLMCVNGNAGDPEGKIEWSATTGLIGYATVEQKYVSRFNFRMMLPVGSEADMWIEYDSSGIWEHCGHMDGVGTTSFMIPVRPRRCDHFAVRIEGRGDVRIYSISKILERGSDVT